MPADASSPAADAPVFESPEVFQRYLDGLGQFRMRLELGRMERCLQTLGFSRPPFAMVRVVGTNGKGSTAWHLARLAAAHGRRAGLYTSPHFLSPKERITLLEPAAGAGAPAPRMPEDSTWLSLAESVYAAGPAAPRDLVLAGQDEQGRLEFHGLTYFEFLTAMAVLHFARSGVELAVIEAGLGAQHDATAALTADLACITPVGLDHENVLGKGLAAIARDKAHALKQGAALAVSAPQQDVVRRELEAAAAEGGTQLLHLEQTAPPPLQVEEIFPQSHHGRGNAQLALATWRELCRLKGWQCDDAACAAAFVHTALPGRMQWVAGTAHEPPLLLDGAHNEDGLRALAAELRRRGLRPQACVAGFMADKDVSRLLPLLLDMTDGPLIFPELREIPRAASGLELARAAGERGLAANDLSQALQLAAEIGVAGPQTPPVLVCGSLYLLGEFFKLRPELLHFQ